MKSIAAVVCTLLLVSTIISAAPSYMDYESEYTKISDIILQHLIMTIIIIMGLITLIEARLYSQSEETL